MLAFACAFTMFAGAAFTDAADINADNTEAVDLLTTLGIIKGYEDGSFDPEGTVTRAEMAKMIYTIRNGGNDNASAHVGNTTSFTDISGHWAEGYIKYLQNTGIVAGKSATKFDPDSQVTTTEAMKMALALAGYDEKNAGLTGINWATNTLTYATTYGLTDKVASAMTAGCARQDAAQILANCLGMTAVRYSSIVEDFVNDSKNGLSWGGDPISVGYKWMDLYTNVGTLIRIEGDELELLYTDADRTDSDNDSISTFIKIDTDYSDLMGQKVKVLFADGKNNAVIGVYAIPDNSTVVVNQKEIGTDGDRVSFGGESYALESEGATVYIDGQKQSDTMRANYFKEPQSADVVTFIDIDADGRFDAASIKTVDVAKVSYVSSTQIIAGGTTYKFADDTIDENVAKDDWVMITRNLFNDNNDIVVVEPVTGTVNAVKTGSHYEYQIGDEWYNEGEDARSNNNIKSNVKAGVEVEAIVVNGIVFAAEKTSGEAGKLNDILFVTYIEINGLDAKTASVMFPDGTQQTIKLDSYNIEGTSPAQPIEVGAYYEYSKSGNTYKLSAVDTKTDAYGDFTNIDNPVETALGTSGKAVDPEAGEYDGKTIADTADVIVYQKVLKAGAPTGYNVKHITGKQLKASFESDSNSSKFDIDANGLGAFTSKVNGLTRVSSLAVLYTGGTFDADLGQITGSSYYGYITKDAVRTRVNGVDGIQFYVWNGSENVLVFADTTNDSDYVAGTIIGYDGISADEDGNNIMSGLDNLTATAAGSISEVGVNNDADTIRVYDAATNTSDEIDLDDFDTVLYMNSSVKDENGAQSGDPEGTPTEANAQQGVRPTNFIRVNNDVAVLDSNAFVSGPYAGAPANLGYTLPSVLNSVKVQWVDNRTQDNTPNAVYPGALVDLTFKVPAAGTLTINNVTRNDNGATNPTFTFDANDVNDNVVIEGLIVTGTVTFTWNGTTSSSEVSEPASVGAINTALENHDEVTVTGAIPSGAITVPTGKTMVLDNVTLGNNTRIYGDGEIVIDGTNTLDSTLSIEGDSTITVNGILDAGSTGALALNDGEMVIADGAQVMFDKFDVDGSNASGELSANASYDLANNNGGLRVNAGGTLKVGSLTIGGDGDSLELTSGYVIIRTYGGVDQIVDARLFGDATVNGALTLEKSDTGLSQIGIKANGSLTVPNGSTLTLSSTSTNLRIDTDAVLSVENGGSLVNDATTKLWVNDGQNGTIRLAQGAKVTPGATGVFTDGSTPVTTTRGIIVGAAEASESASGLSAGDYVCAASGAAASTFVKA